MWAASVFAHAHGHTCPAPTPWPLPPSSRVMCPPRLQSPIHSSGSPRGASLEPNGFCLDGLIPEAAGDNDLREEGRWGVSLS